MAGRAIAGAMADADAFDDAEFLGLSRTSKRDPYRLGLLARHFEIGERATAQIPIAGGTLVVTDRRLLVFTTHLEVDGPWNVREFQGYVVSKEIPLEDVQDVRPSTSKGPREIVDVLHITTRGGDVDLVVSRGPERVVSDEDLASLAGFLTRHSPSPGRAS
jgi:hypothetical protein